MLCSSLLHGQDWMVLEPVICEADHHDAFTELRNTVANQKARTTASNITVTYVDFPENAKQSFEQAIQIWEAIIVSPQQIKIKAEWKTLPSTTLAQSGATKIFRNFTSAPYKNVWYPAALAEAISGKNLNTTEDEITISLNKSINWSYNLNGNAEPGKFDLITVVLHEIAHGLGINSSFELTDDALQGKWGQSLLPYAYDIFVQNSKFQVITDTKIFGNPSNEVKQQITGNDLFFLLNENIYTGRLPQLSAVDPFKPGASVSHLDEGIYPQGNPNSLMTPSIRSAEVIHTPGDLTLLILNQIGWGIRDLPVSNNTITANEPSTSAEILTYPNPADQELNVFIPQQLGNSAFTIQIVDISGREVYQKSGSVSQTPPTFVIDISKWQAGSYVFISDLNGVRSTKRIVVIR